MLTLLIQCVVATACTSQVSGQPGDETTDTDTHPTNGDPASGDPGSPGGDTATGDTDQGPHWDFLKIGGGGFVVGGVVSSDGNKLLKTDTSGGYLYIDGSGHFTQVLPEQPARWNEPLL